MAAGIATFDLPWVMASDFVGNRTLPLEVYIYYESLANGVWAMECVVAIELGTMVNAAIGALAIAQSHVEKNIRRGADWSAPHFDRTVGIADKA